MTRIIGGSAGGRRLRAVPGRGTRPTSDRVREALFSAIESRVGSVSGLRVLDLYAGSGAVGLEAASRGAGRVTLVERDRRAVSVLRDNAGSLGFDVEVVHAAVERALAHPPGSPYDLVFLDPPYSLPADDVVAALEALVGADWLARGALVVAERSSRDPALAWPRGLVALRSKAYGETTLWYGHAAGPPQTISRDS